MKNIAVIGSLGKLGGELIKNPAAVVCPWQFEDSKSSLEEWFEQNPQVDTIWHVARTCRPTGVRRDHSTFLSELQGMTKLLETKAKLLRIVYASSKIVYGIDGLNCCKNPCDHKYTIPTTKQVADFFADNLIGTYNFPQWQQHRVDISNLDHQRTVYALTKLSNESLIRSQCTNYKIIRIWDLQ